MEYTRYKGWGIRATRKFLKDDYVLRYCGKLMSARKGYEVEKKQIKAGLDDSFLYFFKLDSKHLCIDATEYDGTYGRLVNHSRLRPNCKAVGKMIDGALMLILVATRDIVRGEEILYDYGEIRKSVVNELTWLDES